jgi:hypothetical protein
MLLLAAGKIQIRAYLCRKAQGLKLKAVGNVFRE